MFQYRPEIDGLRALAVIPVILFHAGFNAFSGGFVGVDVFFVISGYLITSNILTHKVAGTFSFINFYENRARRILPALFVVMTTCIPFAWLWLPPNHMKDFLQSLVAVSAFASNILFWCESGYFDTSGELKPLLHTWSLAVEEQYYLMFPVFLFVMWRFNNRRTVPTLVVITIVSFALAHWGTYYKPAATFFMLPTRGWEIAIGALLAFYIAKQPHQQFSRLVQEVGGIGGLAIIAYAVFKYSKETPFPSTYALAPVIGALLIILYARPTTLVGKLLSTKVFVGIGLVSYSLYLWHQPLLVFARHKSDGQLSILLIFCICVGSLILALITWKFVELPFRIRTFLSRTQIFLYSSIATLLFSSVGFLGVYFIKDFESHWLSRFSEGKRKFYSQLISDDVLIHDWGRSADGFQRISDCRFNLSSLDDKVKSEILFCHKKYGEGILILGDSHATDLYGTVASRFDNEFLVGITRSGCRPHTPKTECQYDSVLSFVKLNPKAFRRIIFEQAGFYLLLDQQGEKGTREMFSKLGYNSAVDRIAIDKEHIVATIDYLAMLSHIVPTTWFLPRIEPHISKQFLMQKGCLFDYQLRPGLKETFYALDKSIIELIQERLYYDLEFLSQNEILNFDFPADFINCLDIYWSDGDHFSAAGERRFGKRLPADFLRN